MLYLGGLPVRNFVCNFFARHWRRILFFLDRLTIRSFMSISQSSIDYFLAVMTTRYRSMLSGGSAYDVCVGYYFLDFCFDFFARSGIIVVYDDSSRKFKIVE